MSFFLQTRFEMANVKRSLLGKIPLLYVMINIIVQLTPMCGHSLL